MLLAPHHPAAAMAAKMQASASETDLDWQGTVVMQSDGQEDSFSIGPDGCVWNFVRSEGQSPQLLPTGLKASSFAVSRDGQGRLVLFAAHGLRMQAVVQNVESPRFEANHWSTQVSQKWSNAVQMQLPQVPFAISIARVSCEGQGEDLHVGALMLCQRPYLAEHFELAVSRWPQDGAQLKRHSGLQTTWINCWEEALGELRQMALATRADQQLAISA